MKVCAKCDQELVDVLSEHPDSISGHTPERCRDRLAARLATAVEALTLAKRWLGSDDPTETFEDIATWFQHETGMLRPGKSLPLEMGDQDELRRARWDEWANHKGTEVRRAVSLALAAISATGGKGEL